MVRKKNQFIPGDFKAHFFLMKLKKKIKSLDHWIIIPRRKKEEEKKEEKTETGVVIKKIAKSVSN